MGNTVVSVCRELQLVPVERIVMFAPYQGRVKIIARYRIIPAGVVPGSVVVSANTGENSIKKSVSFKLPVTPSRGAELSTLTGQLFVATYIDENGHRRVCGSPAYPLAFSYTSGEGVFDCRLDGEATEIDPFIV